MGGRSGVDEREEISTREMRDNVQGSSDIVTGVYN